MCISILPQSVTGSLNILEHGRGALVNIDTCEDLQFSDSGHKKFPSVGLSKI